MFEKLVFISTFVAAIGSGLIAGVFFAFSVSVMRALGRIPAAAGIAAMQNINVVIINPLFIGTFMGTALLCAILTVLTLLRWDSPGSAYVLAGGVIYLVGSILVTMIFNVPMNNALAAVQPDSTEGANVWANYLTNWAFWNHVRTAASLVSAILLTIALVRIVAEART